MEKISQIRERIKSFFENIPWFVRFGLVEGISKDIKRVFTNQWNYIYILWGFLIYSIISSKDKHLWILFVLIILLFFQSLWREGNWKGKKRKILKERYFHSSHPDKVKREEEEIIVSEEEQ